MLNMEHKQEQDTRAVLMASLKNIFLVLLESKFYSKFDLKKTWTIYTASDSLVYSV